MTIGSSDEVIHSNFDVYWSNSYSINDLGDLRHPRDEPRGRLDLCSRVVCTYGVGLPGWVIYCPGALTTSLTRQMGLVPAQKDDRTQREAAVLFITFYEISKACR